MIISGLNSLLYEYFFSCKNISQTFKHDVYKKERKKAKWTIYAKNRHVAGLLLFETYCCTLHSVSHTNF